MSAAPRSGPADAAHAPQVADAAGARAWLDHLPLADAARAQQDLRDLLAALNLRPLTAARRLEILEVLREPVAFVQIERANQFANRALPLSDDEAADLAHTIDLWEQMRLGYSKCIDAAAQDGTRDRAQRALFCQRTLAYTGLKMFHGHRAYRSEVAVREWRSLNRAYAAAEGFGVADEPVRDSLNRDVPDTSPRIAFLRALLMAAANPNELTQRQLTFVAVLLERLASRVEIAASRPPSGDVPARVVDLAADRGLAYDEPGAPPAATLRFLDMRKLARALRGRIGHLRRGESPARLGLGEDCVQPFCEQLLVFLYRQWCMQRPQRVAARQTASGAVQACNELAAIHFYLSGAVFQQPGGSSRLRHEQAEEIATFGRVRSTATARGDEDYSAVRNFMLESWQLVDQSAQGMQILRRAAMQGRRYLHGQLIAVRPLDSRSYLLGQVRWMTCAENGDFRVGMRLLPGLPSPIAARRADASSQNAMFVPALSLTGVSSLGAPPALVLPSGWFQPGARLELHADRRIEVTLTGLLERGTDFERVSYEVLGDT